MPYQEEAAAIGGAQFSDLAAIELVASFSSTHWHLPRCGRNDWQVPSAGDCAELSNSLQKLRQLQ